MDLLPSSPADIRRGLLMNSSGNSEYGNAEDRFASDLSQQGTTGDHHPESSIGGITYEADDPMSMGSDTHHDLKEEDDGGLDLANIPTLATASNMTKGKGQQKRKQTVVSLKLDDDDEDEKEDEEEVEDIINTRRSGRQRGRPSNAVKALPARNTRGRLSKNAQPMLGVKKAGTSAAVDGSPINRKRGVASKTETVESPRRSLRAAAGSASINIAEQSIKRPKVPASAAASSPPATKRQRKGVGSPARKTKAGKQEWEVEKIVDSRLNKKTGTVEYLVKWIGFPSSDNTWEPVGNLTHCDKKLTQYQSAQKHK